MFNKEYKFDTDHVHITGKNKKRIESCKIITGCETFILDYESDVETYIRLCRGGRVESNLIIGDRSIVGKNVILGKYSKIGRDLIIGSNSEIRKFLKIQDYVEIGRDLRIGVGSKIGILSTSDKATIKGDFYIWGNIERFEGQLPVARRYVVDEKEAKLPENLLSALKEVGYLVAVKDEKR